MSLLRNGLLTIGLGVVSSCGDDKPKHVEPPVEVKKEEPEVVPRHNGRIGLEGEVRCYTFTDSSDELELSIDRTADPRKRKIVYSEKNIDSDTVYRCKPANPEERIVNNFKYKDKFYDFKFWSVLGDKRADLYPVNGFNFDIRRNGSVDFLVGDLDSGKYRLELPVFGSRRDEKGTFGDAYLGTRTIDFVFNRSEVVENGSSAEAASEEKREAPVKTTTGNQNRGQELHSFGNRALEAGR